MNPTGEVHLGPGNNYIKDAKGNQVLVDGLRFLVRYVRRYPSVSGLEVSDKSNRNLSGSRTTADFIQDGDPHENGNIWSSALWDLRKAMGDGRKSDLLVMKMMVMFGQLSPDNPEKKRSIRNLKIEQKDELKDGLAMLLKADELLYKGKHHRLIIHTFAKLGIDLLTFDSAF